MPPRAMRERTAYRPSSTRPTKGSATVVSTRGGYVRAARTPGNGVSRACGFGESSLAGRHGGRLGRVPDAELESLVESWLTMQEVADLLEIDVRRVRRLLRDRQLVAVRRRPSAGSGAELCVP